MTSPSLFSFTGLCDNIHHICFVSPVDHFITNFLLAQRPSHSSHVDTRPQTCFTALSHYWTSVTNNKCVLWRHSGRELWPPESNQIIVELNRTFVPNMKKFPQMFKCWCWCFILNKTDDECSCFLCLLFDLLIHLFIGTNDSDYLYYRFDLLIIFLQFYLIKTINMQIKSSCFVR